MLIELIAMYYHSCQLQLQFHIKHVFFDAKVCLIWQFSAQQSHMGDSSHDNSGGMARNRTSILFSWALQRLRKYLAPYVGSGRVETTSGYLLVHLARV